ncbi:MAG TPA: geranylgeranylglyceryl/heptaprenylglyceryl phosphate synthase [Leeuwenhoekiella sp.]|nr:geranylgeranylglyceryl/heptaprenylglyceryl phosphate synthase [Leeuwenhoekiella sp.]
MAVITVPNIYSQIAEAASNGEKLFAVLIDPQRQKTAEIDRFLAKIPHFTTHILVGGSTGARSMTEACVKTIKQHTQLPVLLFPGNHKQVVPGADALLFLSLISGRNPDYLIGEQVKSIPYLKQSQLEVIPTGYMLIDGGNETSVQLVSGTAPMRTDALDDILHTALAGQYAGKKLIYLEAGSGALNPVATSIIKEVSNVLSIPLVVGGGIRDRKKMLEIYEAGATMVVVGTALENDHF